MIVAKINNTKIDYKKYHISADRLGLFARLGYLEVEGLSGSPSQLILNSKEHGWIKIFKSDLVMKDTSNPPVKEFSKKDLKSGMVVETILGATFLVIEVNGENYLISDNNSFEVNKFNDDLTYHYPDNFKNMLTISRVYKPLYDDSSFKEKMCVKLLVWDRDIQKKESIKEEINRLQNKLQNLLD